MKYVALTHMLLALAPIVLTLLCVAFGFGHVVGQRSAKSRIDSQLVAAGVAYYSLHEATGEVTLVYGVKP